MTPDYLKVLIEIAGFSLSIAALIFTFIRTRRKDVEAQFEEVAKTQRSHERRLTELEKDLERLPGTDEVNRIMLAVTELKGAMEKMSVKLDGTREILGRVETSVSIHQEHLMKGANK